MVCDMSGYNPTMSGQVERLPVVLALFHTCFNVQNTVILIGFIPQMERIVCRLLPDRKQSNTETSLHFITGGLMATPEISVLQAQKEIVLFAERMQRMFGMIRALLDEKDKKEFDQQSERIVKYEDIADKMDFEIAHYLEQVSNEHLSDETKRKIRDMLRQLGELESIGDACYKIARIIQHRRDSREDFTAQQYVHLHEMMTLVNEAMTQMMVVVRGRREDLTIETSQEIEHDINAMRDRLKAQIILEVGNHEYSYTLGSIYSDIIAECEKLGDYVMNVVESRLGKRYLYFHSLHVNLDHKIVTINGQAVSLTRTEFELLRLLLGNRNHVFSRQQLMETVWSDVVITDHTINVHIARLRKKLGSYGSNIVSRQGFGYVFETG